MSIVLLSLVSLCAACGDDTAGPGPLDLGVVIDAGADGGREAGADAAGPDLVDCRDEDGDGVASVSCGGRDCDDANAERYPGATEVCDDDDEDCDDATVGTDGDGDGFVSAACCNGAMNCGADCDDTRGGVFPGAVEVCNGVDDDCNGLLDHPDEDDDGDGYADDACAGTGGRDCDDTDPTVYRGAPELCDGRDSDCSSAPTVPPARPITGEDDDGDGFLPVGATCSGGPRGSLPRTDCDDANPTRFPGAFEICDVVDQDCDPATFGEAPATADSDADGARELCCSIDPVTRTGACSAGGDCDPRSPSASPSAMEFCNGVDDDCDGFWDEDAGCSRSDYAGSIPCDSAITGSGRSCVGATPACCLNIAAPAASRCAASAAACGASPTTAALACDGNEDCGAGERCCFESRSGVVSTTCRTECGAAFVMCRGDEDCPAGSPCLPCGRPAPEVARLRFCGGCPYFGT
jgi:hypothetical protein